MKLLILTQKVDINDDVLGFFHGWIKEFSRHCESVIVVCLKKGEYDLPENVRVLSLGKERLNFQFSIFNFQTIFNFSIFKQLKYLFNFYKYIWQERNNYDTVFVHMNQGYVVLGGIFWRMFNKKISLWYAHGHVPFSLRLAEKLTNIIFTSTKSGFRLPSKKINVVGQGIDTSKFSNVECRMSSDIFKIITIGRISPVKGYDILIKAIEILNKEGVNLKIDIIGGAGLKEQEEYLDNLKRMVKERRLERVINFVGAVANKDIINYLKFADLFVNMSHTGSLDKAIVEAMACELPVLTCNEAMEEVLGKFKDLLMYNKGNHKGLAQKIKMIKNMKENERESLGKELREIVKNNHSLEKFTKKIINILNKPSVV